MKNARQICGFEIGTVINASPDFETFSKRFKPAINVIGSKEKIYKKSKKIPKNMFSLKNSISS